MDSFFDVVLKHFSDSIVRPFLFRAIELDADTVLLKQSANDFAIQITREHGSVDVDHIEFTDCASAIYRSLGHFISENRPLIWNNPLPTEHHLRVEKLLEWWRQALSEKCPDILSGSRDWFSDYPLKPMPISSTVAPSLINC